MSKFFDIDIRYCPSSSTFDIRYSVLDILQFD
jgi:hypothetical protein